MDNFKEQLVTRKPDNSVFIKKAGIFVVSVFIAVVLFIFLDVMSLVLIALLFWGAYFLIRNFDIEYEYICTNGDLDIDKIIAKSRRKRLTTVDLKGAADFGLTKDINLNKEYSIIDASSGNSQNEDTYYIACRDSKYGMCYVLISPNKDMLEVIKTYLPRTIRR